MIRYFLFLFVVVLHLVSCSPKVTDKNVITKINSVNTTKSDAEQLIGLFRSTKDSSYLLRAENLLDSLINTGITDIKMFQLKSKILREKKQYKEFAEFMNESTKHFPDNPQTYFGAGMAYDNIGEFGKANDLYRKSIEVYDRLIIKYPTMENYINRAIACGFLNGKEAGIKEFEAIRKTGKFSESSLAAYQGMFSSFDKSKLLKSASTNM